MKQRNTAAVPPPRGRDDSKASPRPNATIGASGAAGSKVPQLLQQMELMMKSWSKPMQSTMDKKGQLGGGVPPGGHSPFPMPSGQQSGTHPLDPATSSQEVRTGIKELGTSGMGADDSKESPLDNIKGSNFSKLQKDPSGNTSGEQATTSPSPVDQLGALVLLQGSNPPGLSGSTKTTQAEEQQAVLALPERSASILLPPTTAPSQKPGTATTNATDTYEFDEALQEKVQMLEGCRSILGLFTSGCGPYQPILSRLFLYLFDLVESLLQEVNELREMVNASMADEKRQPGKSSLTPTVNAIADLVAVTSQGDELPDEAPRTEGDFKRIDYAFGKIRRMEDKMSDMVKVSADREAAMQAEIDSFAAERRKLQELLEFQASRARRDRIEQALQPDEHRKRMMETVTILDLENQVEKLRKERNDAFDEQKTIRDELRDSQLLNGKYAQQALEIASRVRVYQEQNERFATLLSMQYDERAATEKENELLRSELVDLNKFHQLRHNLEGESGKVGTSAELRVVRYGIGTSQFVPRHLHFSSLMNRITLPKDAALALVADLLNARGSQGRRSDFQTFIHNFLTKKHGADAVAWAYSLDEACRLHDSDVNLSVFSLASRRMLPEDMYNTLHTDIMIFLEACEAVDMMQHGELKLTVPVAHVLGILVEMFPSYPDGAFRKAMEQLQTTLTTNAHAHYRLLFPNLEREGASDADAFGHVDLRVENNFSTTFKELILDDCVVTMQHLEDDLLHGENDRVTLGDLTNAVIKSFSNREIAALVGKQCRRVMKEVMKTHRYEMSVPKFVLVQALREKVVLRRGIFRNEPSSAVAGSAGTGPNNTRLHMANQAMNEWSAVTGEELIKVNYREVIQVTATRRQMDPGNEEMELESEESDVEFEVEGPKGL